MYKQTSLTQEVLHIVRDKGTEPPGSGEYEDLEVGGTYLCRQCGIALFRSDQKFASFCGWPSFDEALEKNVRQGLDADEHRTEILCSRCDAHLGHVFVGEGFTNRNARFCVNSLSLDFTKNQTVLDSEEVIFAAGCFWGVQDFFSKREGVLITEAGYTGGSKNHPSYNDVCAGTTGHYEAVRIVFDPQVVDFRALCQEFFEVHDPTQVDGQGPDIGTQYLSAVFVYNDTQESVVKDTIEKLTKMGLKVVTKILPASTFWAAEKYHQFYYDLRPMLGVCYTRIKRF